jgi:alcohol dehydrogenase class IV
MAFEFATAGRIIFGEGKLAKITNLVTEFGERAFVVTGTSEERNQPLLDRLIKGRVKYESFAVAEEPVVNKVREGVNRARKSKCDFVIGFGGGSVIDTGKAIAAMLTNAGDLYDYLEVIGAGKPLDTPPVGYIAIPTTAGTGAEVTRNAVLGSPEHGVKVSLRSAWMLPKIALVDPELTYSMPPEITAQTGLDALTQVIEPFVSIKANPLTSAICREGMKRAARSLLRAYRDGQDREARRDMSLTSLFGGLALANSKLGAVHGFAGPFGGMFEAPHGAVCGRLLPGVLAVNLQILRGRVKDAEILDRFVEVAKILTGDPNASAEAGVAWIESLERDLNLPGLAAYGLKSEHFPELIDKASISSSMQGNPVRLEPEEMESMLAKAI